MHASAARAHPPAAKRSTQRQMQEARPRPAVVWQRWRSATCSRPGPTPVPPQVLAAMGEPVVHHRSPDFRPDLRAVPRAPARGMPDGIGRLALHRVGHRRLRVGGREPRLAGRAAPRRLCRKLRRALDRDDVRVRRRRRRAPLRVGRDARSGGRPRTARRARGEGRLDRPVGDLDRRRRRRAGHRRSREGGGRARGRRRGLEPRRGAVRDRCMGPRRRRLRLAEGADDAARARPGRRLRRRARRNRARRRASTSTGSGRATAQRKLDAPFTPPVSLVTALDVALGCSSTRASRPCSSGTCASAALRARARRRWGSSCSRPTRIAARS